MMANKKHPMTEEERKEMYDKLFDSTRGLCVHGNYLPNGWCDQCFDPDGKIMEKINKKNTKVEAEVPEEFELV